MERYVTIMFVPERDKGVRSFRIPKILFHAFIFMSVIFTLFSGVLIYDYLKILKQVYQNKHLSLENRQLKEQIQLFHMKLNSLTGDIERIKTFENKLRIITGFQEGSHGSPLEAPKTNSSSPKDVNERVPNSIDDSQDGDHNHDHSQSNAKEIPSVLNIFNNFREMNNDSKFLELKDLYEQKIATNFGLVTGYAFTKEWNELTKQSFALARDFAEFDYKYSKIKSHIKDLEVDIHQLDQFLLDRESFLKATPTLLPTKGWITSYYGPRMSHYSKRVKMHEGLDVGANIGTPIIAPADGIITFSGQKPGFGHYVQIDHGYGIETVFAHNSKNTVRKGDIIKRGQLIAKVGNSGLSTGPHLHYEVRVNGTPVDPLYYILD
ncbi:M23 family metallopeptidase [Halobacteriovorax sp. GB3]|uniref:M23 family metallopeptidase n=1 Tax=Halobacteriovorax sp. GB3 TaxID=2719615 RepID=UPI00235DDB54|nr:M23 family metallopeptidase [Halobacteriovorax sp. GB3]MDD0853137.1 M23 family metallopeptidase [Halobacteriovorax sp. GB3]